MQFYHIYEARLADGYRWGAGASINKRPVEWSACPGCIWKTPIPMSNWSLDVCMKARAWPDFFSAFSTTFFSERVIEAISSNGGCIDAHRAKIVINPQSDARLRSVPPPPYYFVFPSDRLQFDWSTTGLEEPPICRICGRYDVKAGSPEREAMVGLNRYLPPGGSLPLLFGARHTGFNTLFASRAFIELAASNGWRNFWFGEVGGERLRHWEWPEYREDESLDVAPTRPVSWGEESLKRWKTHMTTVLEALSQVSDIKLGPGDPRAFHVVDAVVEEGFEKIPPPLAAMLRNGEAMHAFVLGMHAASDCGLYWPSPQRIAVEECESPFLEDSGRHECITFRAELDLWDKGRGMPMKDLFLEDGEDDDDE